MVKKKSKPTVEDLMYRIERLEACVEELTQVMCSGLKVVADPDFKVELTNRQPV